MAEQAKEADRRAARRQDFITFVWCQTIVDDDADGKASRSFVLRSCDVSQTGMGLVLPEPVSVGTRVFVELASAVGNLSAVGKVMYCRKQDDGFYRAGLQLEIVPPTDRMTLARIVTP